MKKILGILGVAVIAVAMFFSTTNVNDCSKDINSVNLMNLTTANAQGPGGENGNTTTYTRWQTQTLWKFDRDGNPCCSYTNCFSFSTTDPHAGLSGCSSTTCSC